VLRSTEQEGIKQLVQGHVHTWAAEPGTLVPTDTPGLSPLLPPCACISPLRWDGVTRRQTWAGQSPAWGDSQAQMGLWACPELRGCL